jgi:hypothetical protein
VSQFLAYPGFSMARAARSTKVLLTAFNLVVAVAIAVGIVMYQVRTGLTPRGTTAYYVAAQDEGPSALELLDATHPHLFATAFLLFVLGHLFALTRASPQVKTWLAVLGFTAVVVDAAGPWIIRFLWPAFAVVHAVNVALLAGVVLIYVAVPLWELWFVKPGPAAPPAPSVPPTSPS